MATDAYERQAQYPPDVWDRVSQAALVFCGGMYLLLGPAIPFVAAAGEPDFPRGLFIGLMAFSVLIGLACAAANLVLAVGIGRRSRWAWYLGLGIGILYAPSACMPFGAILLYTLVRERGRAAFGI